MNNTTPLLDKLDKTIAQPLSSAGIGRRIVAGFLDIFFILPVAILLFSLGTNSKTFAVWFYLPVSLAFFSWFYVCLTKRFGGTPGKLLLKIRIVCIDGAAADYGQAMQRYLIGFIYMVLWVALQWFALLYINHGEFSSDGPKSELEVKPVWDYYIFGLSIWGKLLFLFFLSNLIFMLFNPLRRSLQDYMAGTVVILIPRKAT